MAKSPTKRKIILLEVADAAIDMAIMVIFVLGLQYFVVAPFVVTGASMETNLHDQEIVLVNRIGHSKQIFRNRENLTRGNVIVFRPPINTKEYYIKRIIGIPGDVVRFTDKQVIVNDQISSEEYTNCSRTESNVDLPNANPNACNYSQINGKSFTVPPDSYFVMGDNRERSSDSRSCFVGFGAADCTTGSLSHFVPYDNIVGTASFVLWPFSEPSSRLAKSSFFEKLWPINNVSGVASYDPTNQNE